MDKRISEFSLADAKARLSELVQRAEAGDEITIKRHGKPAARLVSATQAEMTAEDRVRSWNQWFAYRNAQGISLGPDLTINDLLHDTRG